MRKVNHLTVGETLNVCVLMTVTILRDYTMLRANDSYIVKDDHHVVDIRR